MKTREIISETPLQSYTTFGDFEKPGPFRGTDKKLVPHETNELKAKKFFSKTPYNFRLFFSHISGTGKYSEYGEMQDGELRQAFGNDYAQQIIDGSGDDNVITIVYVGNVGDDKIPMTPWIMAHRFGHAINASSRSNQRWSAWRDMERHFFEQVNQLLTDCYNKPSNRYGKRTEMDFERTAEYNALFNAIGTQRSSRQNRIKRPYEFLYEMFAQYIGTGQITLNPLPTTIGYGRRNWGNPSNRMTLNAECVDDRQHITQILANDIQYMFNDILNYSVGKIYVM